MAQQQHQDTPTVGFGSIQILKSQTLGIGSYGSVCKAQCDDLLCAAKIIHPTLFDPNAHQRIEHQRHHRLPISRFMQECEFMSAIRHPNIVQYLGTHQDIQTDLPVLLMELMDDSLTHFLESSQDTVPYHIQVGFCHDITIAISYLHSNGIIHRDLSSNNVLLVGTVKAKVTDFGMAKLGEINPQATRVSFTMCPGTDAYMPPEAVRDKPIYTAKIDCFAIGTLIVQILTRSFPDPAERLKTMHIDHPQFPDGKAEVRVSEIERRQNHISQVDPNHPLLPIALECLKDSDVERPSAQELCLRIAALKETPLFTESVRRAEEGAQPSITNERDEEIRELQQQLQDKENIIQAAQEEKHQMSQENAQHIQELQQIIMTQDSLLQEKDNFIQQKDQLIKELEQNVQKLKRKTTTEYLQAKPQPSKIHHSDTTSRSDILTLRWREGKEAPCEMSRATNAIVKDSTVYFRAGSNRTIYAYKSTDETWNQLPVCKTEYFSLAIVNNLLTIIGGIDNEGKKLNKLFSLTGELGRRKVWKEVFPPMPTKRSSTIAVCTGQALIVAGGVDQEGKILKTVDILDVKILEWSTAADLPEPLFEASVTICHDRIYIAGGWIESGATKSVYTCILADLLLSCKSRLLGENLTQFLSSNPARNCVAVWDQVADLPVIRSTCVTLHGRLLAIGGCEPTDKPTSDIHIYNPITNTWEVISKMKNTRWSCFAAVLPRPTNKLLVVGGYTSSLGSEADSVEIATIV